MDRIERRSANRQAFRILAALGLAVMLLHYIRGMQNSDTWWHVKVGEYIVRNGHVPDHDIFSWLRHEMDLPWTAHEWLSDVIFYLIHAVAGPAGLAMLSMDCAVGFYALLARQAGTYADTKPISAGILLCSSAVAMPNMFYPRPQIFSFLILITELRLLHGFIREPSRKIYWIPPLVCLWSNLHAGYAMLGYVIPALMLLSLVTPLNLGRLHVYPVTAETKRTLAIITLLSIAAVAVNPIGLNALTYPFMNQGSATMLRLITEWRPPDAKRLSDLTVILVPIVLMLLGMMLSRKAIRLDNLMLTALGTFMTLRSVRFILVFSAIAAFSALPSHPEIDVPMKPKHVRAPKVMTRVILATAIIMAGWAALSPGMLVHDDMGAVMKAVKADAPERPYTDYNLASELIYNDIPVFYDPRADLYLENGVFDDGVALANLNSGYLDDPGPTPWTGIEVIMDKYRFDAFIVAPELPLTAYLSSHPECYELAAQTKQALYFRVIS